MRSKRERERKKLLSPSLLTSHFRRSFTPLLAFWFSLAFCFPRPPKPKHTDNTEMELRERKREKTGPHLCPLSLFPCPSRARREKKKCRKKIEIRNQIKKLRQKSKIFLCMLYREREREKERTGCWTREGGREATQDRNRKGDEKDGKNGLATGKKSTSSSSSPLRRARPSPPSPLGSGSPELPLARDPRGLLRCQPGDRGDPLGAGGLASG